MREEARQRQDSVKHRCKLFNEFFGSGLNYQQVVDIRVDKWQAAKHSVHELLDGLWDVAESKRHAQEIEEAKGKVTTVLETSSGAMEIRWKLSPTESRYSTGGKELLALFLAVKHFPYFLESRDLTVLTDNRPLYFALKSTSDKLNPRKIRQLDYISQFTPDIRQIDGSSNVVADALSRPSIAHLRLSPSIDLAKMAAEQRRVGSPCEEDVSELQLQVLALTTANGTIL
ncbi:hypothetical protein SprV_0602061700 [Sparganum proliferum]